MSETSGAKYIVTFWDEYGNEICKVTCQKEDLQQVVKGVTDQMWGLMRRSVSRWETQDV